MSSIRNPVRKKQLAYERDHYTKGNHNDKRFRKAWPKIKRRMVGAGRHIAEEAVQHARTYEEVILPLRPEKKHKLHLRNSAALQRVVDRKLARRSRSVGAKKRRKANWQASWYLRLSKWRDKSGREPHGSRTKRNGRNRLPRR